jgi:hypothetical protein
MVNLKTIAHWKLKWCLQGGDYLIRVANGWKENLTMYVIIRINIYNMLAVPSFLYGSETWTAEGWWHIQSDSSWDDDIF